MAETKTSDVPVSKNRLYVKFNVDDASFKSQFEAFGKVTDAHVVRGARQRSDYGFITFESEDAAAKALNALQGKTLTTSPLAIEYSQSEKPRERVKREPRAPKSTGDKQQQQEKREPRAERTPRVPKDYSAIKAITLNPDPVTTAVPAGSKMEEMRSAAEDRLFRSGRQDPQKGEFITSLAFKPKQGAGGLNANISFKLSPDASIQLKVISITVKSKNDDTRIAATVAHPESGRQADVYLRHFVDEEGKLQVRHKFLELRETDLNPDAYKGVDESKIDPNTKVDAFFVALDKIVLDRATGLWSELAISLYRTKVLRRAPRVEGAVGAAGASSNSGDRTRAPRRNRRRGPPRTGGAPGGGAGSPSH